MQWKWIEMDVGIDKGFSWVHSRPLAQARASTFLRFRLMVGLNQHFLPGLAGIHPQIFFLSIFLDCCPK